MIEQLAPLGGISGVLLGIGWFLKNKTPLPNDWIPVVLLTFGAVITCAFQGWAVENAVEGITSALVATGLHGSIRSTGSLTKSDTPEPPTTPTK